MNWLRDSKKCTKCFECIKHCPTDALILKSGIFKHNHMKCANCEVCMDICPSEAIEVIRG